MNWAKTFECENPDFCIRSAPDDVSFGVRVEVLERNSEVFRDMFSCCDQAAGVNNEDTQVRKMDMEESASTLSNLFHFLHHPPERYILEPDPHREKYQTEIPVIPPTSAIPIPVLPALFQLADKYALSNPMIDILKSHLVAHKSTHPLRVYALAAQHALEDIANEASYYLLDPPMHAYKEEDIKIIPSAVAYHKLLRLQAYRKDKLRQILITEDIFPHDYGACSSHKSTTVARWNERRNSLYPFVESGTDVAAEMATLLPDFQHCPTCYKACTAATDMLGYKCRRVPRRIDNLPQ